MDQLWGVVIGGVLTLVGSFGAAHLQARHQRRQARAQDLWDRRADLYLDLLTHLSGRVSFSEDPGLAGYGPKSAQDLDLRWQLYSRVTLFASRDIHALSVSATEATQALHAEVAQGDSMERIGDGCSSFGGTASAARTCGSVSGT